MVRNLLQSEIQTAFMVNFLYKWKNFNVSFENHQIYSSNKVSRLFIKYIIKHFRGSHYFEKNVLQRLLVWQFWAFSAVHRQAKTGCCVSYSESFQQFHIVRKKNLLLWVTNALMSKVLFFPTVNVSYIKVVLLMEHAHHIYYI